MLNSSRIRFWSHEIYRLVEGLAFKTRLKDSLYVGRRRDRDKDEAVFLVVRTQEGRKFQGEVVEKLKRFVTKALSLRHVPKIFESEGYSY